jgi:hypothetical protein
MLRINQTGFAVIEVALIAVGTGIIGFTGWYVISANHNADKNLTQANSTKFATPNSNKSGSGTPAQVTPSPTPNKQGATPASKPQPFSITKVFFQEYPSTPKGAEEGSCYDGQEIKFRDTAQVTHTGSGTAQYHWEMGDPMNGTVKKFGTQSVTFNGPGVTNVSGDLTYTVYDTSKATGLPSPAFQNRPHLNLVFTSPDLMYANKEKPVYTSTYSAAEGWHDFFIWGNYIMLCD